MFYYHYQMSNSINTAVFKNAIEHALNMEVQLEHISSNRGYIISSISILPTCNEVLPILQNDLNTKLTILSCIPQTFIANLYLDYAVDYFNGQCVTMFQVALHAYLNRNYRVLDELNKVMSVCSKDYLYTVQMFLNCNLDGLQTSKCLYTHRNTLWYRLDKINELTGIDVRKYEYAKLIELLFFYINNQ